MKSIIFLLLALSVTCSSQAASFDCAKAVTKMEKAICDSSELSGLDEVLAASYKSAKNRLSSQSAGMLVKGQVSWLRYTSSYCFVDYDARPALPANANKCLLDAFRTRIQQLNATGGIVAGYKTYLMINNFIKLVPADKFIYTVERIYPQVDSESEQSISLNKFLADIEVVMADDSRGSEAYSVSFKQLTTDWFVKELHSDNMLGPYPQTTNSCSVYSVGFNRPVRYGDIFVNRSWQLVAKTAVNNHFKALARKEKDFQLDMVGGFEQFEVGMEKDFQFCLSSTGMFVEGFLPHVLQALDGVTIGWDMFHHVLTPYALTQLKELSSH